MKTIIFKSNLMKVNFKFLALVGALGLLLQSCNNDDDAGELLIPVISNFKFGEGASHTTDQVAYKGSDIHLEADISASVAVQGISLAIHAHDLELEEGQVHWEFNQEFSGMDYQVMNPTFHEHIDVPVNIPAGEYHIELTVTDSNGETATVEGHLQILDPIALSAISVDTSVVRGSDFHAEFLVNAIHGIHAISVDIHAHGITPGEGEINWEFAKVFEQGYHELTEAEFHEHIDVPANVAVGEYHMVFSVEDEQGNIQAYDTHLEVTE
jgi:uncharacterized protein involved in high-affinity Fe2+ transport